MNKQKNSVVGWPVCSYHNRSSSCSTVHLSSRQLQCDHQLYQRRRQQSDNEEEALKAEEEDTMTSGNNATISNETIMDQETGAAAAGDNNNTIVRQETVSSPGEEAGPFQIIDLLPPTLDGTVYTGWVSFTATKPILVAPLNTCDVSNETLDPAFGELFVFPGIPNGTMIAPAITMPDYATQKQINSDIPMRKTYSATAPFHCQRAFSREARWKGVPSIVYAVRHGQQGRDCR